MKRRKSLLLALVERLRERFRLGIEALDWATAEEYIKIRHGRFGTGDVIEHGLVGGLTGRVLRREHTIHY